LVVFYADLHIHSKFSRATSRDADLEHMAFWARKKGVSVVGTGDFTHPEWFAELEEKLVPAEPGLYRLRPDMEREVDSWLSGAAAGGDVRFLLEVEISTIYKKDDATRKVHHLLYAPDLEKADKIRQALGRIGNISSDGRPILGLDSRDLLEITLEGGEGCYLIPAHIWTPWFAVLGSKSGFDTIEHCYGDLTSEIFAVETGLSSDPPMNWRLSALDKYTLVSNSDAHSPPKIGREACAFDCELSYWAMRDALKTGDNYGGTVEFFPEEGKYHMDGHRKCGVRLSPEESRSHDGRCPDCGKPLTLGVLHRVAELADREEPKEPETAAPFRSLVPLEEVIAEIQGVGPKSQRVQQKYESLVSKIGSELTILEEAPIEDIKKASTELVAEAIDRMRRGEVRTEPGYDGEYGKIRLFGDDELKKGQYVPLLFDIFENLEPAPEPEPEPEPEPVSEPEPISEPEPDPPTDLLSALDPDQRAAATSLDGPLLIVAGPGTGKTRTLTHRIAHYLRQPDADPSHVLAITFTRQAAEEMRERLATLLGADIAEKLAIETFHSFGLRILSDQDAPIERVADEHDCEELLRDLFQVKDRELRKLRSTISDAKRLEAAQFDGREIGSEIAARLEQYNTELRRHAWVDFDDLLVLPVRYLAAHPDVLESYRERFRFVSIDEYQDIEALQYRLVRLIVPSAGDLCAIGDPDQAIYGFRGADVAYFERFRTDFPTARTVSLTRNYRSSSAIVDASKQVIAPSSLVPDRALDAVLGNIAGHAPRIEIRTSRTEKAEAEFVVHSIEKLVGGSTFFSMDSGRVDADEGEARDYSFSDFAILYRTDAQAEHLVEALSRSGMPFQKRSHHRLCDEESIRALLEELSEDTPLIASPTGLCRTIDRIANSLREDHPNVDLFLPALREIAAESRGDLKRFSAELALGVDVDFWDPRAEAITLLTLHAAKGLEFPVVFLTGVEDGIIPLRFGESSDEDVAEERRLFFVGMTRAQDRLIVSHAEKRLWRGETRDRTASPFLEQIEQRLRQQTVSERKAEPPAPFKQLSFF